MGCVGILARRIGEVGGGAAATAAAVAGVRARSKPKVSSHGRHRSAAFLDAKPAQLTHFDGAEPASSRAALAAAAAAAAAAACVQHRSTSASGAGAKWGSDRSCRVGCCSYAIELQPRPLKAEISFRLGLVAGVGVDGCVGDGRSTAVCRATTPSTQRQQQHHLHQAGCLAAPCVRRQQRQRVVQQPALGAGVGRAPREPCGCVCRELRHSQEHEPALTPVSMSLCWSLAATWKREATAGATLGCDRPHWQARGRSVRWHRHARGPHWSLRIVKSSFRNSGRDRLLVVLAAAEREEQRRSAAPAMPPQAVNHFPWNPWQLAGDATASASGSQQSKQQQEQEEEDEGTAGSVRKIGEHTVRSEDNSSSSSNGGGSNSSSSGSGSGGATGRADSSKHAGNDARLMAPSWYLSQWTSKRRWVQTPKRAVKRGMPRNVVEDMLQQLGVPLRGGTGDPTLVQPLPPRSQPWPVQTNRPLPLSKRRRVEPPHCTVCDGTGRICCERCCGHGRTNMVSLPMLPSGSWPQWCWLCKGSGLGYCHRCLGTGERRGVIGFHTEPIGLQPKPKQDV